MSTVAGASASTASPKRTRASASGCRLEGAVRAAIDLVEQPERDRRQEDDDDEDELDQRRTGEAGERTRSASRPPTNAADRHPAEEPGQDRRDRLGRVAEDEDELARPDDLVHQPGGAGQDEDRQDESGMAHRRECQHPADGRAARRRAIGPSPDRPSLARRLRRPGQSPFGEEAEARREQERQDVDQAGRDQEQGPVAGDEREVLDRRRLTIAPRRFEANDISACAVSRNA